MIRYPEDKYIISEEQLSELLGFQIFAKPELTRKIRSQLLSTEIKKVKEEVLVELCNFLEKEQNECNPAKHLHDVPYYSGICCEAQYVKGKIKEIRGRS